MAGLADTLNAIDQLRTVPRDWDSYGGGPVDKQAQDSARTLVARIARLGERYAGPIVGPDVDGGVELIWELRPIDVHVCVRAHGGPTKVIVLSGGTRVLDRREIRDADELIPLLTQPYTLP